MNITINGTLFVITLNGDNGVTRITTPTVKEPGGTGQPFYVEYDPAGTLSNVYAVYELLLSLGLI